MIRNYSDADIKAAQVLGGNGYSSNGVPKVGQAAGNRSRATCGPRHIW
jgi:hypothetical protein